MVTMSPIRKEFQVYFNIIIPREIEQDPIKLKEFKKECYIKAKKLMKDNFTIDNCGCKIIELSSISF